MNYLDENEETEEKQQPNAFMKNYLKKEQF